MRDYIYYYEKVVPRGRYIFYSNSWRIQNISASKMERILNMMFGYNV